MTDIESLLAEREGYVRRSLPDRVAQVDAELARLGYGTAAAAPAKSEPVLEPVIETATIATPETATIKRGPGRPRKPTE